MNMDINYHEVTAELDPREILRYLNQLGIHNISGEVLKFFITDLKKLIKYDLQQRSGNNEELFEVQGPERLHSASTFSSRIRSKTYDSVTVKCTRECNPLRMSNIRNIQSAPNLGPANVEKPLRRACSCVPVERKTDTGKQKSTTTVSHSLIKVPKLVARKKCDPVSLYHYYTSLWSKYRPNLPGENDWSDLRWCIRQKMAGNVVKHVNKVSEVPRYAESRAQGHPKELGRMKS